MSAAMTPYISHVSDVRDGRRYLYLGQRGEHQAVVGRPGERVKAIGLRWLKLVKVRKS